MAYKISGIGLNETALDVLRRDVAPENRLGAVLRPIMIVARKMQQFACDCAERVQSLSEDQRSLNAIATRQAWLNGDATDKELAVARTAARHSAEKSDVEPRPPLWDDDRAAWLAWVAARTAARTAAWSTCRTECLGAFWEPSCGACRAAAWDVVSFAARAVAQSALVAAFGSGLEVKAAYEVSYAARDAEYRWQIQHLIKMLDVN